MFFILKVIHLITLPPFFFPGNNKRVLQNVSENKRTHLEADYSFGKSSFQTT